VVDPFVVGNPVGILLLPKRARRAKLERWFDGGVARGTAMPIKDSLIAATALAHDLPVATRNTADFRKAGVRLVDPFA
jgi:toxin FitB